MLGKGHLERHTEARYQTICFRSLTTCPLFLCEGIAKLGSAISTWCTNCLCQGPALDTAERQAASRAGLFWLVLLPPAGAAPTGSGKDGGWLCPAQGPHGSMACPTSADSNHMVPVRVSLAMEKLHLEKGEASLCGCWGFSSSLAGMSMLTTEPCLTLQPGMAQLGKRVTTHMGTGAASTIGTSVPVNTYVNNWENPCSSQLAKPRSSCQDVFDKDFFFFFFLVMENVISSEQPFQNKPLS